MNSVWIENKIASSKFHYIQYLFRPWLSFKMYKKEEIVPKVWYSHEIYSNFCIRCFLTSFLVKFFGFLEALLWVATFAIGKFNWAFNTYILHLKFNTTNTHELKYINGLFRKVHLYLLTRVRFSFNHFKNYILYA